MQNKLLANILLITNTKIKTMKLLTVESPMLWYPLYDDMKGLTAFIYNAITKVKAIIEKESMKGGIIIICTGSSGMCMATLLQTYLSTIINNTISIHYIRKDSEKAHNDNEKIKTPNDYIIWVDDFTDTGTTFNRVKGKLSFNRIKHIDIAILNFITDIKTIDVKLIRYLIVGETRTPSSILLEYETD